MLETLFAPVPCNLILVKVEISHYWMIILQKVANIINQYFTSSKEDILVLKEAIFSIYSSADNNLGDNSRKHS